MMHLYLIKNYVKFRRFRDKEYDICLVLLILNLIVDYGVVSYYDKANCLFLFVFWLKIKAMREQYGSGKRGTSTFNEAIRRGVLS